MNLSGLLEMQGMLIALTILGAILTKIGIIKAEGKRLLTDLVIFVTLPAAIIESFMIELSMQILYNSIAIIGVSFGLQIGCVILAKLVFSKYKLKRRKVLQYATVCANSGIMGNPIAESAFGGIGLLLASMYLIPQRIFMWSVGLSYFTNTNRKRDVIKKVATHPCIIAIIFGIFMAAIKLKLPGFLNETIISVANANTAVSMLLIGSILVSIPLYTIVNFSTLFFSFIRLIIIPALTLAFCLLLRVETTVAGVSVLLSAMPAASTTAVLANKYKMDEIFATKIVVLSTILSVLTAPVWCYIIQLLYKIG